MNKKANFKDISYKVILALLLGTSATLTLTMIFRSVGMIPVCHMRGTVYSYTEGDSIYKGVEEMIDASERGYSRFLVENASQELASNICYTFSGMPENFNKNVLMLKVGKDTWVITMKDISADRDEKWEIINEQADKIVALLPEGATTEEKIKFLHDYICDMGDGNGGAEYVENIGKDEDLTLYTFLTGNNLAVCREYAATFSLLLTKIGVENRIVTADYDGIGHIWNSYDIDGVTYYTDAYWDDISAERYVELREGYASCHVYKWYHKTYDNFADHIFIANDWNVIAQKD